MAVRISKIHGGKPILNIHEVADDFMADERLSVKNFGTKATTEWANFVMNNRNKMLWQDRLQTMIWLLYSENIKADL